MLGTLTVGPSHESASWGATGRPTVRRHSLPLFAFAELIFLTAKTIDCKHDWQAACARLAGTAMLIRHEYRGIYTAAGHYQGLTAPAYR
jgi:hypothetical protein